MGDSRALKVGDLLEVGLPNESRRYLQYIGDSEDAELVRVIRGVFANAPPDFAAMAGGETDFICMLPLRGLVEDGALEVVAHARRPAEHATHPLMRTPYPPNSDGSRSWALYDGQRVYDRGGQTDEEMSRLPIREVVGFEVLRKWLVNGWDPTRDPVETWGYAAGESGPPGDIKVFFVASSQAVVECVTDQLRRMDFVGVQTHDDNGTWTVTGVMTGGTSDYELFEVDEEMERLADRCGAEYDGNDVRVG